MVFSCFAVLANNTRVVPYFELCMTPLGATHDKFQPGSSIEIVAECWAPYISGGLYHPPPPTVATSLLKMHNVLAAVGLKPTTYR